MIILTTIYGTENEKLAQTGYQFLSVTSDARSGGMADAMTTIHGRSVSLFFNPAGIARQTELVDINFSSNNWIAGIKHNAFSLSFSPKSGQYGVFGLSLLNVDYGEMQGIMKMYNVGQDTRFCPGGDKETSYMYELGFPRDFYGPSAPWAEEVKAEAAELFHLVGALVSGEWAGALARRAGGGGA